MITVKLALRELWGSRRQLFLPAFTLTLAVASLLILLAFDFKITEMILSEGRGAMGADIQVRAIRPIAESEREKILEILPEGTQESRIIDFNTMMQMSSQNESRFVRLQATGESYPFYGNWTFTPKGLSFKDLHQKPAVFVPRDVVDQYKLVLGDKIRFGELDFELKGIMEDRPGQFTAALGFAPSVWISSKFVRDTGLLDRPGRVDYERFYKLPEGSSPLQNSELLKKQFENSVLRIRSYQDSQRGFQRIFDQVKLYGQIIALAALIIASFSIFGSLQTWFRNRRYLIAILRSCGASKAQINQMVLTAGFALSLSASLLGLAIGHTGQALLSPLLNELVALPEGLSLPPQLYMISLLAGVLSTLLFSLLSLLDVASFKPILLIRSQLPNLSRLSTRVAISSLLFFVFFLFASYLTRSFWYGMIVSFSLIAALALAAVLNFYLFRGLQSLDLHSNLSWLYALRSLLREKRSSLMSASLFFLVALILSAMVIVEKGVRKDFEVSDSVRQSSMFVFDLGEEKKAEVDAFIQERPDVKATWASWVQTRWLRINGKPLQEHMDEVRAWDQERPMQISNNLPENSRVVEGEMWTEPYTKGLLEMSVSDFYSSDRNIKVGDILSFSIYGVEFDAKVSNIRKVKWTDFQPAFGFMFQDGFFEGLPMNYLASLATSSRESRLSFLRDFSKEFPDLSLIDVSEVKQDLTEITNKIVVVARVILLFLVFLGLSLVAALSKEKLLTRRLDFANFKAFGASKNQLMSFLSIEYLCLSLAPSLGGAIIGVAMGNAILKYFFSSYDLFFSYWLIGLPFAVSALVLLVGLWGSFQLSRIKPRLLFADH